MEVMVVVMEHPSKVKKKIDYTKAESIESIYEPIISLSQENDNIALIGTEFAEIFIMAFMLVITLNVLKAHLQKIAIRVLHLTTVNLMTH
jgi:hypothetical protein